MNNLKKYLYENLNKSDFEITKISSGMSSVVYLLNDKNKKYIMKTTLDKDPLLLKRIKVQYDIQKYLCDKFPVSEPLLYSYDNSIIGKPFYISEFIEGESQYDTESILMSYDLLSSLHNMSIEYFMKKITNNYLENFINKSYFLYKKYKISSEKDITILINWLYKNIPYEKAFSLTHNDWKMDNILFKQNNIVSVIDWELFEIGDPRLDLAVSLSWCFDLIDNNLKKQISKNYFDKNNFEYKDWYFFEILGMLRVITLLQITKYKYDIGAIAEDRFKNLGGKIDIREKELIKYYETNIISTSTK